MKVVFRIVCLVLAIALPELTTGQGENNNWYFGNQAGITFNSGSPVKLLDGSLSNLEACATVSDRRGNLLFYTDGTQVWNKHHNLMNNGSGLKGSFSSTSVQIINRPYNPNRYYIFTSMAEGGIEGLQYAEVDIAANGGNGQVVSKNQFIRNNVTEKLVAIRNDADSVIWLVGHELFSNGFISYRSLKLITRAPGTARAPQRACITIFWTTAPLKNCIKATWK